MAAKNTYEVDQEVRVRKGVANPVLRPGDRGTVIEVDGLYVRIRFSMGTTYCHVNEIEATS